ncbi:hypothetical protein Aperf_G00000093109 [Anoplocephala perfoliata]
MSKLNHGSECPPNSKVSETTPCIPPLLKAETQGTLDAPSIQLMGSDATSQAPLPPLKFETQIKLDTAQRAPPSHLRLETPLNLEIQNDQLMRIERLYKAKLARMSDELRFLRSKSQFDTSQSLPDVSKANEVPALKMTIARMESEQIDLMRLALHYRDRLKQVLKENADMVSKYIELSEAAELAKRKLAMAESERIRALEEVEVLKSHFAEALRDHEVQQQGALNHALNQSDARLEAIRASLLLAEKNAAESNAKALHSESQLADSAKRLHAIEVENKYLRDENIRLIEEKKVALMTANFQSQKTLKRLTHFQEQVNIDEDEMRDSISMLKSQLQDALKKAEKSQTDLVSSNEEQIRLLTRANALEIKLRQAESDLATAIQQHEVEMGEVVKTARARESYLTSALESLTQLHETKMSRAEEIINQQRRLLGKLREECRNNVEIFDGKLSHIDKQHQILLSEAEKAKELIASSEEERDRFQASTLEHLAHADQLAKQIFQLEVQISDTNFQMAQLNGKNQELLKDARILVREVKYLQSQLSQHISEKENVLSDQDLFGSQVAQEAIRRIELFVVRQVSAYQNLHGTKNTYQYLATYNRLTRVPEMGFFYFFNCLALAGGPHVLAYRISGLKENDAFWRCCQVIFIYGLFQLARMFLGTLIHLNIDTLSSAGIFNYEALGVFINLLAVRFIYLRMLGRSDIAVAIGAVGWSYGDLIFTKIIPLWTGTRQLEFDWAYIALSLDANFELIFNFIIFLVPWLLMRKEKNFLAACVAILIFIISCFHLSIFGLVEQQIDNTFYAVLAKALFSIVIGFIGFVLRDAWTVEAPYEPKKKSEDSISFFGLIGQLGNFCLQTIRNAVANTPSNNQRSASRRRN